MEALSELPVIGIAAGKKQGVKELMELVRQVTERETPAHLSQELPEHKTLIAQAQQIKEQCVTYAQDHLQTAVLINCLWENGPASPLCWQP